MVGGSVAKAGVRTAVTAADEKWLASALDELAAGLRARAVAVREGGGAVAQFGRPADVAARMLAAVPSPSPWAGLGPYYSTKGVAAVLGDITRQAVDDRRRRGRVVAVRTEDGVWAYPAFQFDSRNHPIPGVAEAFAVLAPAYGEWTAASALLGAQPELGGASIVGYLADGGAVAPLLELCRSWAARWRG